jgi:hypothetical protein
LVDFYEIHAIEVDLDAIILILYLQQFQNDVDVQTSEVDTKYAPVNVGP